ncbi:MAG: ERF family protein [Negativicutes bacterium]|nr:ERF family protein [Negativicutes bacterium]
MQKLASKLVQVMKEVSYVEKKGSNDFHHYSYATSADVLLKVNAALTRHAISSIAIPEVLSMVDVIAAKGNTEHLATLKMDVMLIDAESGETVTITGLGSGQDGGDKAVMKAQTAAIKYAYLLSMAISTGDDPEADGKTDESMEKGTTQVEKNQMSVVRKKTKNAAQSQTLLTCSNCGITVTQKVMQYSEAKYGRSLCMECQQKGKGIA